MNDVELKPGEAPEESVLGYRIFKGDRSDLIETVIQAAQAPRNPFRVGYLNAAQFNLAVSNPEFDRALRSQNLLYADGQSVLWAARRFGIDIPERLTAADFMGDFLRRAATARVSVALVGGQPGAAASFSSFWRGQIPGLEIPFERDGFFSPAETGAVLQAIRRSQADVVLVGMGAPRQENLTEQAVLDGETRVWWSVGALFEYGPWGRTRAPLWMRRAGLEWAFRLAQEPRRLATRYLIGNPLFVWRVFMYRPD